MSCPVFIIVLCAAACQFFTAVPSTATDSSSLAEELLFLKKHGKISAAATWGSIRASFDFKAVEHGYEAAQNLPAHPV